MQPFNLQAALAGAPVVDGYGEKVTGIVQVPKGNPYQLVGVKDNGTIGTYTIEGVYNPGDPSSRANLFMATEKRTGYVNIWKNNDIFGVVYANVHYSKEQADAERKTSCSGKGKTLLRQLPFEYEFSTTGGVQ